jgi:hypothetical protein
MMMVESRDGGREFYGAAEQARATAPVFAPFLIDTAAIRNDANLLKIKRRDLL